MRAGNSLSSPDASVWRSLLPPALAAAAAAAVVWFFFPQEKIVIKTEVVVQERVVEKVVTRRRVEVKKPDGTVVTSTTDKTEDRAETVDSRIAEKVSIIKRRDASWGLGAFVMADSRFPGSTFIGGRVERRIGGGLWIEVFGAGSNDGAVAGGAGISFKF